MITRKKLIESYLNFFKGKNHKIIPSASLIPENDPTVLFTTAGMHPLVPYLLGEKHPLGKRLVNVQKCIRTTDIEEVGDEFHHTFFEMLGNWSLGDYWKEDAIKWTFEFHTKILGIPLERYAVSVFKGDKDAPEDKESIRVWLSLGIPKERIAYLPKENNWWGPAGKTGPCGPDTEMFYWLGKEKAPKRFDPKDKRWIEIGNNVFMEYNKTNEGNFVKLKQKNVDFGGGVERTLAILNGLNDDYLTEVFLPIIKKIEEISGKKYGENKEETKAMRIIADHLKAAIFILADDKKIKPSNKEQGYVLRRLIRRAIRYGKILGIEKPFTDLIVDSVIEIYPDYDELKNNKEFVISQLKEEELKFTKTLKRGLKKFEEFTNKNIISGKEAFLLYQSYGFPLELTQELAKEKGISVDVGGFKKEEEKHQKISKTASEGIFKSGLSDHSEKTIRLHTATHLLNEALRKVLDEKIKQRGSNITPERLRFDFNFNRKLSKEEIKKIEDLVNKKINEGLKVVREEMSLDEALKSGAQSEFGTKYPERVSVYTILDPSEKRGWFSKEICTGPHVKNTKEIGKFEIIKEESVSAGVRRIKAIVK
ncbi:MAG: alanine--tRNA ligase [Candidatus Pacearchaeota archaeon]|nr:MAG: alanine--tRNA ligase [Candidatus Pacearchaeota archaeon]